MDDRSTPVYAEHEMNESVLALTDMRGNFAAVALILIVGVILIRRLRPTDASHQYHRWLPLAALVCGPILALLYFVVDVTWISPETYILRSDYYGTLWRVLAIGVIGGAIGAFAFWIETQIPARRERN